MSVWKQKPKPPLDEAIHLMNQSIDIMYRYLRDRGYRPSADEYVQLEILANRIWQMSATANYIIRKLHLR